MELSNLLEVLTSFIAQSAKKYDEGNELEAIALAVHIRMLCHDTPRTMSLLKQLQLKNNIFLLSTTPQYVPANPDTYHGLVVQSETIGPVTTEEYVPLCSVLEGSINKWHGFEDWWSELAVNHKAYTLSRKDIVLMIANMKCGTYVDEDIDKVYAELEYDDARGWVFSPGETRAIFSNSEAFAAMREIAQEVIIAVEYSKNVKSYTRKAMGKVNAMHIDDVVYFAPYECEKDSSAAKMFMDARLSGISAREIFCDSLIFEQDDSRHDRFVVI